MLMPKHNDGYHAPPMEIAIKSSCPLVESGAAGWASCRGTFCSAVAASEREAAMKSGREVLSRQFPEPVLSERREGVRRSQIRPMTVV